MRTLEDMMRQIEADIAAGKSFQCPFCGHDHEIDSDVSSQVVSYWGEEPHDFSCSACGKDFIVDEDVTRMFSTRKPGEERD